MAYTPAATSTALDTGRGFATAAMAVTLVPFGVLLLAATVEASGPLIGLVAITLGTPHVLATAGLYLDPDIRAVAQHDRARAIVLPAVSIVVTAAVFGTLGGDAPTALLLTFLIWQTHHFTKQNVGMVAFWLRATERGRMSPAERRLIQSTTLVGALGILRRLELSDQWDDLLRLGGFAVAAAGAGWVLRSGRPVAHQLALLVPVVFYLPLHVFPPDLALAALTFAAAHGAQYYLMVGHVTGARRTLREEPFRFAQGFVLYAVAAVLLVLATSELDASTAWIFGLGKGVVVAHFLADARLWRLRNPEIGAVMKRRFAFL